MGVGATADFAIELGDKGRSDKLKEELRGPGRGGASVGRQGRAVWSRRRPFGAISIGPRELAVGRKY